MKEKWLFCPRFQWWLHLRLFGQDDNLFKLRGIFCSSHGVSLSPSLTHLQTLICWFSPRFTVSLSFMMPTWIVTGSSFCLFFYLFLFFVLFRNVKLDGLAASFLFLYASKLVLVPYSFFWEFWQLTWIWIDLTRWYSFIFWDSISTIWTIPGLFSYFLSAVTTETRTQSRHDLNWQAFQRTFFLSFSRQNVSTLKALGICLYFSSETLFVLK